MYDLTNFTLSDMTACGAALRKAATDSQSMEQVASRVVRHLYDELRDGPDGRRACVLVRFFKTHPYAELGLDLQTWVRQRLDNPAPPLGLKCLTLLATAGELPEWSSRRTSVAHRAIPLDGREMLQRFPMISQLVAQFGLEANDLLAPDPTLLVDLEQRNYNVFHVPRARGSSFVPSQDDFVTRFRVESVLGFGGLLPGGDLFAVILFSRTYIPRETADLFKALALSCKLAVLPFASGPVFEEAEGPEEPWLARHAGPGWQPDHGLRECVPS
jgi:hypothetical protein